MYLIYIPTSCFIKWGIYDPIVYLKAEEGLLISDARLLTLAVRIVEHFLKKLKPFRRVFDIKQFYILNLGIYFKQQQYQIYTS
jgi:hypothetical protein